MDILNEKKVLSSMYINLLRKTAIEKRDTGIVNKHYPDNFFDDCPEIEDLLVLVGIFQKELSATGI